MIFTDAVIQPGKKRNEFSALCDIIDNCTLDDGIPLFITDRGFPSFNMFAHAAEKGVSFLSRVKDLYMERLLRDDLPADQKEFDLNIERIVTRSQSEKSRSRPSEPDLYRYVDRNTQFDFMAPGSSEEYPLSLRVVRVEIADGAYENLITNLPADEFDMASLKSLYHVRWGIETAFRYLKHAVGAADFHCRAFDNVSHEVWARLILFNFCSAITALSIPEQPTKSKYVYAVNFTMAYKNAHFFLKHKGSEKAMIVMSIIQRYIRPIRPGRYFERRHRLQVPMKFSYRH